jgi:hypothetical protein
MINQIDAWPPAPARAARQNTLKDHEAVNINLTLFVLFD